MEICTENNKEFRGAGTTFSKAEVDIAWKRVRDIGNKEEEARALMVEAMIMGGTHPTIRRGLGE